MLLRYFVFICNTNKTIIFVLFFHFYLFQNVNKFDIDPYKPVYAQECSMHVRLVTDCLTLFILRDRLHVVPVFFFSINHMNMLYSVHICSHA